MLPVINPAFMHRCLDLASLGRGRVGNGALVGAVLVRGETVIAEGYHRAYGDAHAERMLLESYPDEVKPDDVLYVNVEPCCHQGMTPACTNILIDRGVKHVVYGMVDPDTRVSGKGIETLQAAGITVTGPLERASCERFNKGFSSVRVKDRPWITIKMAKDRANRVSNEDGTQLKITSKEQDSWSHNCLRSTHDAIVVGVGTIFSDNPLLNRRFEQMSENRLPLGLNEDSKNQKNSFQPYKIVLDPRCTIPVSARVIGDRTIICIAADAMSSNAEKAHTLESAGVRLFPIRLAGDHFDWGDLWSGLITPKGDYHGITSILVEGGSKTWQAFASAGFVDEEITLTAPASS